MIEEQFVSTAQAIAQAAIEARLALDHMPKGLLLYTIEVRTLKGVYTITIDRNNVVKVQTLAPGDTF